MLLIKLHNLLKSAFRSNENSVQLPEGIGIHFLELQSDINCSVRQINSNITQDERKIISESGQTENQRFNYTVVVPTKKQSEDIIFLLHGLNERSWDKYLLWAWYLAKNSGKGVVMFPIAYHMNRAPQNWSNPREMIKMVKQRILNYKDVENSSFANIALSLRMEHTPEMLPISGIQTYFDIVKLTMNIKSGQHPLFKQNTNIDFFAYSIGALLAEILLIANPASLFSRQRAFLFCGGSTFDKMNPNSKAIMDSRAVHLLRQYILSQPSVDNEISIPMQMAPLLPKAWETFKSMVNSNQNINKRKDEFANLGSRIESIGLTKDKVIPPEAIRQTIGHGQELDFPFEYTHESPFPMNGKTNIYEVEKAFKSVFDKAVDFLK